MMRLLVRASALPGARWLGDIPHRWLSNSIAAPAAQEDPVDSGPFAHGKELAVVTEKGPLERLATKVTSAIHSLIMLVTSLHHTHAQERYVRRVLTQQVGLDPISVDVLRMTQPQLFRLSVRQDIEPVVALLRSQGLKGSALAEVITGFPAVLSASVEEALLPACTFLRSQLGSRALSLLVRHPQLLSVPSMRLSQAHQALRRSGVSREASAQFLWLQPALYARLADALHHQAALARGRGHSVWRAYRAHVEQTEATASQVEGGERRRRSGEPVDGSAPLVRSMEAVQAAVTALLQDNESSAGHRERVAGVERAIAALEALGRTAAQPPHR